MLKFDSKRRGRPLVTNLICSLQISFQGSRITRYEDVAGTADRDA